MNMKLISSNAFAAPSATHRSSDTADSIAVAIRRIYDQLEAQPDLAPSSEVSCLFSALVDIALTTPEHPVDVLMDPRVDPITSHLRRLCGQGECALESAWAQRILESPDPQLEVERFPYAANYRQLCRMEIGVLASALPTQLSNVGFVGCGPLPLSSMHLAQALEAAVVNIDHDPHVLDVSRQVMNALGVGVSHLLADAERIDYSGFDVVVLAALVGESDDDKRAIMRHISTSLRPGALLLARSAHGLRELLYPPIPDDALDCFDKLAEVHPVNDIVNSVILARSR